MLDLRPKPFAAHLFLNKVSSMGVDRALSFEPNSLVDIGFKTPIFSF